MIRVYSVPNCSYCSELKRELKNLNINFFDVDVSLPSNLAEFEVVMSKTGNDNVPVVNINNKLLAPNHSYKTIEDLLVLIVDLMKN